MRYMGERKGMALYVVDGVVVAVPMFPVSTLCDRVLAARNAHQG